MKIITVLIGLTLPGLAWSGPLATPCNPIAPVFVVKALDSGEYEVKYSLGYKGKPHPAILKPLVPYAKVGALPHSILVKRTSKRSLVGSNGIPLTVDVLQECSPGEKSGAKYSNFLWRKKVATGECKPTSSWPDDADYFAKNGHIVEESASKLVIGYRDDDGSKAKAYFAPDQASCDSIALEP